MIPNNSEHREAASLAKQGLRWEHAKCGCCEYTWLVLFNMTPFEPFRCVMCNAEAAKFLKITFQ